MGLAILVAIANAGVHTTTGPDLVPGLRTAGLTAVALTLLGVAIALILRRPALSPALSPPVATSARQRRESDISA
ncbi:hypothetical protein [Streptomyces sp. NPDC005799]|uniref:hypothetical protein n=1 Tax=Streptomyces sp. NPDC005799 TaxID=3154678 RepID=UPI0033E1AB8B